MQQVKVTQRSTEESLSRSDDNDESKETWIPNEIWTSSKM